MNTTRTIVSATEPRRYADSFTEILLNVWFEELSGPVPFLATPFDCERHGKQLWIRAMAGHYGQIEVIGDSSPINVRPLSEDEKTAIRSMMECRGLIDGDR